MTIEKIVAALIDGERDAIANMANTAAAIWEHMPDINWAGCYISRNANQLVLGPFQGKPACIRIPFGRGVCGTAAATKQTILVPDVDAFADHIVCDANSRSELVVPIVCKGAVVAVIDIDSATVNRFTNVEAEMLERVAVLLGDGCDW